MNKSRGRSHPFSRVAPVFLGRVSRDGKPTIYLHDGPSIRDPEEGSLLGANGNVCWLPDLFTISTSLVGCPTSLQKNCGIRNRSDHPHPGPLPGGEVELQAPLAPWERVRVRVLRVLRDLHYSTNLGDAPLESSWKSAPGLGVAASESGSVGIYFRSHRWGDRVTSVITREEMYVCRCQPPLPRDRS